jgi:hypothetical protein
MSRAYDVDLSNNLLLKKLRQLSGVLQPYRNLYDCYRMQYEISMLGCE